ncbi:MAG: undecaprenyl-diphosphate phosphatase [Mycobacteriales bacterium]
MSYLQAIVIGLIQGITELFPISSLGHTVLVPSWLGGSWATLVHQEALSKSPYLAFIVGLHLATAVVLLAFYWREWVRLIGGFLRTIARRRIETDDERLAWLIVLATIPVGALGLALEHTFRVLFARPLASAIFLTCNGVILLAGERARRRREAPATSQAAAPDPPAERPVEQGNATARRARGVRIDAAAEHQLAEIGWLSSLVIGAAQSLALLAGISREGVAMVGGLYRGLSNENALRFAFLLSTPVIFAAGALKVPDLLGPLGHGVRGPILAGSVAAMATSAFAVAFLTRYFRRRTLLPFAGYSLVAGLVCVVRFGAF